MHLLYIILARNTLTNQPRRRRNRPGLVCKWGRAQGPPPPRVFRLYHRAGCSVGGCFHPVPQYPGCACQLAIYRKHIVPFGEVAFLCQYQSACLIENWQCYCCQSLWPACQALAGREVETEHRFVYKWVRFVLVLPASITQSNSSAPSAALYKRSSIPG